LVDRFVAPSQFLAERYIAWGIPRNRIATIENVVAEPAKLRGPVAHENFSELLRVGFFGQISALKGINVLFEAAAILERRDEHNVVFEIYGDHTNQPPEFQTDFLERLAKAGHNVRFCGPYDRHRVDSLMQSVDLILIPSIWWENSPVVIQEALRNRRPVVCSDVGGMAEKVRDGLDGFHFPVGNSVALASLLVQIATTPSKLEKIRRTMRSPASADEVAGRYSQLYDSLL
jgi:glycosyltransferase involved in cell wall biosynthesis